MCQLSAYARAAKHIAEVTNKLMNGVCIITKETTGG
jgi:hypothetical protein